MADPALTVGQAAFEGRQIPWSEEAELSVLGGMLIDGDAVAERLRDRLDGRRKPDA